MRSVGRAPVPADRLLPDEFSRPGIQAVVPVLASLLAKVDPSIVECERSRHRCATLKTPDLLSGGLVDGMDKAGGRSDIGMLAHGGRLSRIVAPSGDLVCQDPDSLKFDAFNETVFPLNLPFRIYTIQIEIGSGDVDGSLRFNQVGKDVMGRDLSTPGLLPLGSFVSQSVQCTIKGCNDERVSGKGRS